VLSLLLRFYEAKGGVVAIDGKDVTSLDPSWLRSHLAFVQQEPVLFGASVRDNVAYALEAAHARRGGTTATASKKDTKNLVRAWSWNERAIRNRIARDREPFHEQQATRLRGSRWAPTW